ncbi:endonuclease/exonuclease/phosphatase family protein [Flavobacterium soyangense]|uniref:Endonuclease/exonuclease/phosphatase family protein n=1 Tax=Flavobacterium soyangense TaxID=2023265 RepID=A0A930UB93_9FLAO|nr:endonuclease/exonuclease/phosphatase family protein [Flavobacterium soyangense]MBF2707170.1 endonuclease/exonuclease/phosphatase family protein [Flavobacterium soyangense]
MKIIEWNCQGAFRKKNNKILALKPDILVVTECESEVKLEFGKSTEKPNDFFWYGNGHKGIGIFSYCDYKFELLKEFNPKFSYIIPLKVSDKKSSFLLFAIWAKDNVENPEIGYITQVWLALEYYSRLLNLNSIFIGDFNSNQIWDDKHKVNYNHTAVVEFFKRNDIFSLYHEQNKVAHGQEKEHTFHMYRKIEKPYHIDYCFASSEFLKTGFDIQLCKPNEWLEHSDHVPMIIQLNKPQKKMELNNSLLDNIIHKTNKLNSLTITKFDKIINQIKTKATKYDFKQKQEEKMEIFEAMERIIEIDKHITELIKNGY